MNTTWACPAVAALPPIFETNGRDQSPVIRLFLMDGSAVAIESVWIGIGAMPRPGHVIDAACTQLHQSKRREIKLEPAALPGNEEPVVVGIGVHEPIPELWAHFVIGLADGGTDHRFDLSTSCPKGLHRRDRRFKHAEKRALPASMGGANDT